MARPSGPSAYPAPSEPAAHPHTRTAPHSTAPHRTAPKEHTMGRLFGTDGVRGLANRDLTAELALDLSVAAAHVLASIGAFDDHRPRAVIGRDPRASGEFLSAATIA